jgi:hypothetical protein
MSMMRNKIHALSLTAALAICYVLLAGFAPVARTQGAPAVAPAPPAQKIVKAQFVVLHMLYQSLQVRGVNDMREIHTFQYSPGLRDKMQNIFNAGGYQYGDKVVVWYHSGEDVALKIKGKPSKSK